MAMLPRLFRSVVFMSFAITTYSQNLVKDKDYFLKKAFYTYPQVSEEFRMYIDSGLVFFPKDAQLWRENATSYFKAGQYERAIKYINRAVELDTLGWLGYRGFMKCIFMKDYVNAIIDLKEIYRRRPLEQKMDHSYPFWIGISYLKLGQLDSASIYLQTSINQSINKGKDWVHFVDWYYFGLIKLNQKDYSRALEYFDNAMAQNSVFPDVAYYKAVILINQGKIIDAKDLLQSARSNLVKGYRMNEDNEVYVNYPYQITTIEIDAILEKLL